MTDPQDRAEGRVLFVILLLLVCAALYSCAKIWGTP